MHRQSPVSAGFRAYTAGGCRSVVEKVDDTKLMQEMAGGGTKGEKHDKVESPQNYGFTSVTMDADKGKDGSPGMGAETFISFMGGNRSFPVAGPIDDRRHRLKELEKGDVAMFRTKEDQQQLHMTTKGGFWSAPEDKTVRMQLVKKKQQQQGGQGGSGGSAKAGEAGGGGGGAGEGQDGAQKPTGQKAVYKDGDESHRYVDVTENATNASGKTVHLKLDDGKTYVHVVVKQVYLGGQQGGSTNTRMAFYPHADGGGRWVEELLPGELAVKADNFGRVWTDKGLSDNVFARVGGGGGGSPFVRISGDTMTGNLGMDKANPQVTLNKTQTDGKAISGQTNAVMGQTNGVNRWRVVLGDVSAEGAGGTPKQFAKEVVAEENTGSDFRIDSYNDDGSFKNIVLHADRETSAVTITAGPEPHHAILALNKLLDGQACSLQGRRQGSLRWQVSIGDGVKESDPLGQNIGSDFRINSYDDGGNFLNAPLLIDRKTSRFMMTAAPGPFDPILAINKLSKDGGQASAIHGWTRGVPRWGLSLGDGVKEDGGNTGSDFRINCFDDDGKFMNAPVYINRKTNGVLLTSAPATFEPMLALNKLDNRQAASLQGWRAGLKRWGVSLGDGVEENGGNSGSDFRINSFDDDGRFLSAPLLITRATGQMFLTCDTPATQASLAINKTSDRRASSIQGWNAGRARWALQLGDAAQEDGNNTGSDFRLHRYDDNGNLINVPIWIERHNGQINFLGPVSFLGGVSGFAFAPPLILDRPQGQAAAIQGKTSGVMRWQMSLGDIVEESGTASGSDFRLNRFNNAGDLIDVPLWIKRDSGQVQISGPPADGVAMLALSKAANKQAAAVQGQLNGVRRWHMALGDGSEETGNNTGSDFRLQRYTDLGAFIDVPMWVRRDTGVTVFTGSPPDQKPIIVINKTSGAGQQSSSIQGQTLTSTRWHLALGDGQQEYFDGSNVGADFRVHRHHDNGAFNTIGMYIARSSGDFGIGGTYAYKSGGGSWSAYSDARIKTVVGDYTSGLDQIKQLQPRRYRYNGSDVHFTDMPNGDTAQHKKGGPNPLSINYQAAVEGKEFIGLVAQEAEGPMPELVSQVKATIDGEPVTDMRMLDPSAIIFALVNACKELSARVEALEARVA